MADVGQKRVTALWREAAAALEEPLRMEDLSLITAMNLWRESEAECGRLREQLDAARASIEAERAKFQGYIDSGHNSDNSTFYAKVDAFDFALEVLARAALGVVGEQDQPRQTTTTSR